MIRKLRKKNGETLIESLAAVLICVMAMGMLASSIMATSRINYENRNADEKYAKDMKLAEGFQNKIADVTITFTSEGGTSITDESYRVDLYGNADGNFAAYKEVKQ